MNLIVNLKYHDTVVAVHQIVAKHHGNLCFVKSGRVCYQVSFVCLVMFCGFKTSCFDCDSLEYQPKLYNIKVGTNRH